MNNLGDKLVELDEKVDLRLFDEIDRDTTLELIGLCDEFTREFLELTHSKSELELENKELKNIIIDLLRKANK